MTREHLDTAVNTLSRVYHERFSRDSLDVNVLHDLVGNMKNANGTRSVGTPTYFLQVEYIVRRNRLARSHLITVQFPYPDEADVPVRLVGDEGLYSAKRKLVEKITSVLATK